MGTIELGGMSCVIFTRVSLKKGHEGMSDDKKYVAPPNESSILRMLKIILSFFKQIPIAFKTPYRNLTTGQKVLKFFIQLAIVAAVLFVAYLIVSIIIGIILAIIILYAIGAAFGGDDEIEVTDKWGNKERYRKY